MKVFIAVFICKILYFAGKLVGKGSSLPGKIVLRLFPDALCWLRLPETIIAVTGSNGKTTTTELIVHALEAGGMRVGCNREGSNQTEGVATLLLRIASFRGKVNRDAIVMECDERYTKQIFGKVKPSILLVTNLCRDQLSRNGHPEFIEDCLRVAIDALEPSNCTLILNADDPYVAALATQDMIALDNMLWFGVRCKGGSPETREGASALHRGAPYDDGAFCPRCKSRMTYAYRIAGHYGKYECASCGLKRADPQVEATMLEDGSLSFGDGLKMNVALPSITGAYNFCAALAVAKAVDISVSDSVRALDNYELTGGRVVKLSVESDGGLPSTGLRKGLLLISKHENSFAYDRSLSWIVEQKNPCTVIVVVDAISRKYYTSETSWLWDIDFDLLADENVKNVVLAGSYVNELAMRFAMSAVDRAKIGYVAYLNGLREYVKKNTMGDVYIVTCFSDKAKTLKAMKVSLL